MMYYWINGDRFPAGAVALTARQILIRAWQAGVLGGPVGHYVLGSLSHDGRRWGRDDLVDLTQDDQFIAISDDGTTAA